MADWSTTTKHSPSEINGGQKYDIIDRVPIEQLNTITENTFYALSTSEYASNIAENIASQLSNLNLLTEI